MSRLMVYVVYYFLDLTNPLSHVHQPPSVIYPEVLVVVDYNLYL